MHSKNNNKSQTHIQGLRPFSSSIPKSLKKHLRKGGYNYSSIVDNWTRIVSRKLADACYPITVKMGKEMREGTLVVNVIHGKELEVEYEKNQIKDRVNSFFGYKCISNIVLKIIQAEIKMKKNSPKIKDFSKIENKMKKVNDEKLKNSLNNFLKAFHERSN